MKLLICTQAVDKNHPILGFFLDWIREFSKDFSEIHVICLQKGEYDLPAHVHIYSLGKEDGESRLKYTFRFYRYFTHIFFQVKVDFVFFHMGAIYNILAAPFFFMRKLYHTQFYWWKAHGHINTVGRFASLFVDSIYTSTESGFPFPSPKRKIVGQAINTTRFVFPETNSRKAEIIFVGRIMPVKQLDIFLQTAQLLISSYPDLSFSIIGPIGNEEYYKKLQDMCKSDPILKEKVKFRGPKTQDELVSYYQNTLIFLNTSQTHSMDKTVLEASLCGCVPVTANKAFVDFLQPHGLYTKHNAEGYAAAIIALLKKDMKALQSTLREGVVAQHSLQTFSARIFGSH